MGKRALLAAAAVLALVVAAPVASANEFVRHIGGPGSGNGQFSDPLGAAVDPSTGDLYVTDASQNLVEKFDPSGNFLFSFGGGGTGVGQFSTPRGVAVDPSTGDVYVVDLNNNRVEKFDAGGNFELQFGSAGSGPGQFNHSNMVAVDPANRDVYVTDIGNNRVEKFDPNGNFLSQFGSAGTGNGQFNAPNGIAVDPGTSNVYVTDFNNQRVQQFTSSGTFTLAFGGAGTGPGQFGGPFGVAVDAGTGDVYVTDGNRRVQKFDSAGDYLSQFGSPGSGDGQLNAPGGVAVDLSGNVFVADSTNARVDEFDSSGGFLSQFGASGTGSGQFSAAAGAAVDAGTGELYVVDGGPANRVQKFTAQGAFESTFGTTGTGNGQFTNPHGPAIDSSTGNSYIVDSGDNRVEKFEPSGAFITAFGTTGTGNGQFGSPLSAAVDPATRDVYVTDESNHRVQKFDPSGAFLSTFGTNGTGPGQFSAPIGVAVDPSDGSVYVSDVTGNRVQKFDSSGNFLLRFGSTGAGAGQFSAPKEIAVNPANGHVFVLDSANTRIEEFDSRGRYLSQFGAPGNVAGQFNAPDGLAIDPVTGGLYVVSVGGTSHIQKFGQPPAPVCANATGFTTANFPDGIQLSCTASAGFSPTYQLATPPAHGTISNFSPYTGFFFYTPDPGFTGTDTFTYHGSVDGAQSADRTVKITVASVPACQDVSASTGKGIPGSVQLNCTDAAGSPLTYTIDSPPSHGALGTVSAGGAVTYTPNAGFTGVDTFLYHATNADGLTSSIQVAHITVNPPPTCEDTFLTTPAGARATATFSCVDIAGAPLNYATFSSPAHGTLGLLNQSTGQVSYTPAAGFSGTDSFTYAGSSANGTAAVATVHITVNAPPSCQNMSASTGQGNSIVVPLNCSDATGATVAYGLGLAPSHGSVSGLSAATGEVTYTPAAGFHGSDSFTYHATSANGASNRATVSITVNPNPACQNVSLTTGTGQAAVATLNCSDPNATVSYALDTQPAHGALGAIAQPSGQLTYTPNPGYSGTDSFTYHATSADGSSNTSTVSVTVNAPPACHSVSPAVNENQPTPIQLACSDSGAATLTYLVDAEPSGGALGAINQSTGQVLYAPAPGFSGVDAFTYHATSANGVATSQTVTIRVRPVVTFAAPAQGASTKQNEPLFSGTASTGELDRDTVTVQIVSGSTISGGPLVQRLTPPVAPNGAWSAAPTTPLADGTYTARVLQQDAAGLTGVSDPHTFTVDTVAPAVGLAAPANGAATSDSTPTFSGAGGGAASDQPSVSVKVFSGSSAAGTPVETFTAPVSGGSWSAAPSQTLPDGTYTAQAQQSDAAGNTGLSSANTFTVDTVQPAVELHVPATCSSTTTATPAFSGNAGTASGDLPAITVKVFAGTAASGSPTQTLTTTASGNSWSVPASAALPGGTYTAQALQSDAAGNTKATGGNTFNIATTTTSITSPAECSFTNNTAPTLSGNAGNSAGDSTTVTVKIFTGFTTSGTPLRTLTTTRSAAAWSVGAGSALPNGTYTAQAVQALAGGTSTSPGIRFTVDTVAPTVTLTSPANGSSTSDTTPTLSGSAGTAGGDSGTVTVKIFAGSGVAGTPIQTLTANVAAHAWSATPTTALPPGTYTAQATQGDQAGNTGTSTANTFTIS